VFEKAAEYLTGNRTEIYGRALDWGKEHEKEAFHYFSQQTDEFFTYYGAETYTFITYGEWGGYSPDALGGQLVEIKCPFNSGNHLQNFFITKQRAVEEQTHGILLADADGNDCNRFGGRFICFVRSTNANWQEAHNHSYHFRGGHPRDY
jgi:hypothetical protein